MLHPPSPVFLATQFGVESGLTNYRQPTQPARPPRPSAIEIEGLTVERGGRVILDDLSLSVPRGSVCGMLGPSGCGKTTLIRAIVGMQIISSGSVRVLGAKAGARSLRSRVGYVTQAPSVYGDLTVDENLRYFAQVLGASRSKVDDVLEIVDLVHARGQLTAQMSGGQRMRVSLATALLNDPELLVLDEPRDGRGGEV
jgi:ABC-2 type transport system ATP-binding protein